MIEVYSQMTKNAKNTILTDKEFEDRSKSEENDNVEYEPCEDSGSEYAPFNDDGNIDDSILVLSRNLGRQKLLWIS